MDQLKLKEFNKALVLRTVARAADGITTQQIIGKTKLSLRTVQTHLRSLRSEGKLINQKGLWMSPDSRGQQ